MSGTPRVAGARKSSAAKAGNGANENDSFDPSRLTGFVAVVVGAFGAVGVAGSLFVRMVRNEPELSSLLLLAALAVGAIAILFSPMPWWHRSLVWAGVLLAGGAVYLGTESQKERENPRVVVAVEEGSVVVSAEASSLRSDERLSLDVRAVRISSLLAMEQVEVSAGEAPPFVSVDRACRHPEVRVGYPSSDQRDRESKLVSAGTDLVWFLPPTLVDVRQLSWTETGSDVDGNSTTSVTTPLPDGYDMVCVHAALAIREPEACTRDASSDGCQRARIRADTDRGQFRQSWSSVLVMPPADEAPAAAGPVKGGAVPVLPRQGQ